MQSPRGGRFRRLPRLSRSRGTRPSAVPARRALNIALHAAHHGEEWRKVLADLERALELVDDLVADAAGLAEELAAVDAFAAGLRLSLRAPLWRSGSTCPTTGRWASRCMRAPHHRRRWASNSLHGPGGRGPWRRSSRAKPFPRPGSCATGTRRRRGAGDGSRSLTSYVPSGWRVPRRAACRRGGRHDRACGRAGTSDRSRI